MSASFASPASTSSFSSIDSPLSALSLSMAKEYVPEVPKYQPLCARSSLPSVWNEVMRIQRVFAIYQAFGIQRTMWKRNVQGLIDEAGKGRSASLNDSEICQKMDATISKFPDKVKALYPFEKVPVALRIARLKEDLLLVPACCPIRAPSEGVKAVTLITDYSYENLKPSDVIKLTSEYEALCNELYAALFRGFSPEKVDLVTGRTVSYGIFVPRTSNLDLSSNKYQGQDAERALVFQISDALKKTAAILKPDMGVRTSKPDEECKQNYEDGSSVNKPNVEAILFQEKVVGQNFSEFVDKQYTVTGEDGGSEPRFSTTETEKMYELIGRLYEFDQWLGNGDRIGNPNQDETTGEYDPSHATANPGNIMIQSQGGFRLWAIDNELSKELIVPGSDNDRYIDYLKKIHETEESFNQLAQEVILSLHEAVSEKISRTPQGQINLSAFEKDLGVGVSRRWEIKIKHKLAQRLPLCSPEQVAKLKDALSEEKHPFPLCAQEAIAILDEAIQGSGSKNSSDEEVSQVLHLLEDRRKRELQQGIAYNAIRKGMKKALQALKLTLIPAWDGDYMISLKKSLQQRYSEQLCSNLFEAQSARFKAFQLITSKFENFQ